MSKARFWMVTINNPNDDWKFNFYGDGVDVNVRYVAGQMEEGENGTPHFQGYVELKRSQRLSWLKNNLSRTAHWEKRKGSQEDAITYVTKEDTRKDGPWYHGEKSGGSGERNDLKAVKKLLDEGSSLCDVADQHFGSFMRYHRGFSKYVELKQQKAMQSFRRMDVRVFCGKPGTGKTRSVYTEFGYNNVFALSRPEGSTLWCDGYESQKCLLIDDFYGWIPYCKLLRMLDGHPFRLAIKGGFRWAAYTTVVITSNTEWDQWYLKPDLAALERRISSQRIFTEQDLLALEAEEVTDTENLSDNE